MSPAVIGPFEVIRELGRGGMGEVYLARDTRLDRRVAIKALPTNLASDPDRLARFQREARVLASLNHPAIGAIYGLEESAGNQYLVLEFVEGETLADRLVRGAIPVEETLTFARQIAEALEAAHDKGVIHRDLKPGNVMVTPDGGAKVLDFGLARADDNPSSASHAPFTPDSPTLASPASPTIAGIILGSPGYMSPEQALGKTVDKRSDIFAFGCVLFEMLTGERTFVGENATASLGAVLHVEPDWSALPEGTPPRIRELLTSSLTKDRRQRLHDIGDARLAIEQAIQGREWTADSPLSMPAARRRPLARGLPWALAGVLLITAAGVSWRSSSGAPSGAAASPRPGPIRLRVDLPEAPPAFLADTGSLAISPDGEQVAYVSRPPGQPGFIAVRRLNDLNAGRISLPLDDPDAQPVPTDIMFSPDGRLIAGFQNNSLYLVPVGGGEPTRLSVGKTPVAEKGAAWTDKGLLFTKSPNTGLLRVSEKGGDAEPVTAPDASSGEISHRYPDVLPDGRRALITIKKEGILTFDDAEIALLDLGTGKWKTLIRGGSYARYVPTGHIIFARNGSIMAVPFDIASGEVTGTPVAVVSGVMTSPSGRGAVRGLAPPQRAGLGGGGTLVYMPGGVDELKIELVWLGLDGAVEPVGMPPMAAGNACLSPDGGRIATGVYGASDAVFVYDLARRTNTRITYRGNCGVVGWLRDGSRVACSSDADGLGGVNLVSADGSGTPLIAIDHRIGYNASVVLVDGKPAFVYPEAGDIWIEAHGAPRRALVSSQFDETWPHVSPDGKWLSYASNESGQYEVYVRPFPSGDGRWQVSVGGGRLHCWMPHSDALVYTSDADRAAMRAPFESSGTVVIGRPEPMFTMPAETLQFFEAHPDGKRFLAARELPRRFAASQVYVILNWFDELKAKVPSTQR